MAAPDLAPQTAQGARQASVRAITGTANTYEGDWHALFDRSSIAAGPYEGRLLTWINQQMGRSFTNLPEAQQAYAALNGAFNWSSLTMIWTPATLGGALLGWWDAERSDLITQSGGAVSSWKDAIAGYDAAQATGGSQPTYAATSFNSRPGLTFDGVAQCLAMASQPFPSGASASELWVLADQTALPADTSPRVAFSYGGDVSTVRRGVDRTVVTGVNRAQLSTGDGSVIQTTANTNVDLTGRHVVRAMIAPTVEQIDVDGVAGLPKSLVPATGISRARIGAISNTAPANFWQGVINTVLVTSALTTAQAALLLAYLKTRGSVS